MHHHNHYYGHSHILARYAGLDDRHPPRLRGYLQHGWNVADGYNPTHEFFDGAVRYVWSPRIAERGYALGRRNYTVVGAPWLYLQRLEPELGFLEDPETNRKPVEREGTLWFLFHGWEGGKIEGDHKRLIDEIRETEDGPVTFSLYYTEYDRPEIRNAYLDAGFEVISFGRRGFSYLGTDTEFLYKQLTAMRRHKRVAGNRLATAILYGAAAGCEIAVYGDPMMMEGEDPRFGGYARVQRLWPDLIGKDIDQRVAQQITREELGARYLLTPAEVRRTMFDGSNE
ncbi:hypothetical protein G9U51_02255 [Calidifontibacter sp. DB0510]|uniref:Uncharacterized protein n=1 Tax=Metallococcus carri TaxID=1656884 RepID=A0A967E7X2_9MICO|nr:hypothetical protein [Metallococcus carri]NHN54602.1 hypothetical protein [Metallococcus carri]NOP36559.1 hypothetical protein [Calidifontibacter sp. DB2511S]